MGRGGLSPVEKYIYKNMQWGGGGGGGGGGRGDGLLNKTWVWSLTENVLEGQKLLLPISFKNNPHIIKEGYVSGDLFIFPVNNRDEYLFIVHCIYLKDMYVVHIFI